VNDVLKNRFEGIDYQLRPASYWRKRGDPLDDILRQETGRKRRQIISRYWKEGRLDELDDTMEPNTRGFAEQNDPATFRPSLMEEEDLPPYLPDRM